MGLKNDAKLLKQKDNFVVLPVPMLRDSNHLAISKTLNNKQFLNEFNIVIKNGYQSGEIAKIIRRYNSQTN